MVARKFLEVDALRSHAIPGWTVCPTVEKRSARARASPFTHHAMAAHAIYVLEHHLNLTGILDVVIISLIVIQLCESISVPPIIRIPEVGKPTPSASNVWLAIVRRQEVPEFSFTLRFVCLEL